MMKLVLLGNFGGGEIFLIAVIVLLLFGGKKIPELMRGIGKGVRSFREGVDGKGDPDEASKDSDSKE